MKTCKDCQDQKPLSEFNRDINMKDGRQNSCKSCVKEKRLEREAPKHSAIYFNVDYEMRFYRDSESNSLSRIDHVYTPQMNRIIEKRIKNESTSNRAINR